ncbi:unnamed protein product [Ambrosiozyma monospora]|uniref:Unnamed protein product n=1 Tax=Ambrosiozyma monospora TaxID=43982 RepID=A0A9W6YVN8_AMBMO|nr:unnamed protein product [Ambrosiozyma monospora]
MKSFLLQHEEGMSKRKYVLSPYPQLTSISDKHQPTDKGEMLHKKYSDMSDLQDERLYEGYKHPNSSEWSYKASLKDINRKRNRFSDAFPFDKTRVPLKTIDPSYSDYINADYLNLRTGDHAEYIATQGPMRRTFEHFWYMCHQNCQDQIIIVMLTPLTEGTREQCYPYWSHKSNFAIGNRDGLAGGDKLIFYLKNVEKNQDYRLSEWEMTAQDANGAAVGKKKQVLHFHFDKWQDFQAADSTDQIIDLSKRVHELRLPNSIDPVIVHCAAGVGRTGTFITIDYFLHNCQKLLLEEQTASSKVTAIPLESTTPPSSTLLSNVEKQATSFDPLFSIVQELRSQRPLMVQRFEQFVFTYDTVRKFYLDNINENGRFECTI